jgi:hypothetical protein
MMEEIETPFMCKTNALFVTYSLCSFICMRHVALIYMRHVTNKRNDTHTLKFKFLDAYIIKNYN